MSGNRIVDIAFFIQEMQIIRNHDRVCTVGEMVMVKSCHFERRKMPKRKINQLNIKSYNEKTIQKALEEIKVRLPKKTVAKKYGIPRSTLQFRLSKKFKKI